MTPGCSPVPERIITIGAEGAVAVSVPLGRGEGLRDGRGKPFTQLQAAGVKTAVMDEIMRRRDPALKEAVEASLAREIRRAFEKLGDDVGEVKPDNIAGAVAARWLALSPEAREPAASARERSAGMDHGL